MSIPIICRGCGALVGEEHGYAGLFAHFGLCGPAAETCPGKGKHQAPVRTETAHFFGIVKKVRVVYPETFTKSQWYEYMGPKKPWLLWLAMLWVAEDGIIVDGKWCWWRYDVGFFGDGYAGFKKA